MDKKTDELMKQLKQKGAAAHIEENKNELIGEPLNIYLLKLIDEKGLTKANVIKKGDLHQTYGQQIFSGIKNPSRDKLLRICFGAELNTEETQTVLKYAGFAPLYPRSKRDSVIIEAIENNKNITECNIMLDRFKISPIT